MMEDLLDNETIISCLDLHNMSVMEIFGSLTVPSSMNESTWSHRETQWYVFFYFHVAVFALMFLLIGIASIVFLSKRHLAQRFKAKTFIAIDIALAILGFSKFLFYVLDPFGISGYCTHMACIVVSRLLFAVGFPSLTATYTLVFITLWNSAEMRLGRACVQQWRVIIPLCFIHYLVAISFEFAGIFAGTYPVLLLLIGCEAFFITWGLFVCVTFLVAGIRLLRSVKSSGKKCSVVARDTLTQTDKENKEGTIKVRTLSMKIRRKKHQKQALRKVAIITYTAAILGAIYSLMGIAQLVMLCLQLFECNDEVGRASQSSDVWLALKYIGAIIEVLLAILLLYSINDVRPVLTFLKKLISCCIPRCGHVTDAENGKTKKSNVTFSYEYSSESPKETTNVTVQSPFLTKKKITTNGSFKISPDHMMDKNNPGPRTTNSLNRVVFKDNSKDINHADSNYSNCNGNTEECKDS